MTENIPKMRGSKILVPKTEIWNIDHVIEPPKCF
jgi:hypothetical protein